VRGERESEERACSPPPPLNSLSSAQVLAYAWDVTSRGRDAKDKLIRAVDEQENNHNEVVYVKQRSPRPLADRDSVTRMVWKAQGAGFVFATAPTTIAPRPLYEGTARVEYLSAMKIIKINDDETRLEYLVRPDGGGNIPAFICNFMMVKFVAFPMRIQEYFQKVRPLSNWDAKDGRAVGEALLIKVDAESKKVRPSHLSWEAARMRFLFAHYEGLKEAGERWEWLETMLARVAKNKLR
jgi:hypothetical protein